MSTKNVFGLTKAASSRKTTSADKPRLLEGGGLAGFYGASAVCAGHTFFHMAPPQRTTPIPSLVSTLQVWCADCARAGNRQPCTHEIPPWTAQSSQWTTPIPSLVSTLQVWCADCARTRNRQPCTHELPVVSPLASAGSASLPLRGRAVLPPGPPSRARNSSSNYMTARRRANVPGSWRKKEESC